MAHLFKVKVKVKVKVMRKGFFINPEEVSTKVHDHVSRFVPDQALPLRDLLLQFSYLGEDKLSEIVNRGFDGDEDAGLLGVDVSQLDFSEVHDRMVEMRDELMPKERHSKKKPKPTPPPPEETDEPDEEASEE